MEEMANIHIAKRFSSYHAYENVPVVIVIAWFAHTVVMIVHLTEKPSTNSEHVNGQTVERCM